MVDVLVRGDGEAEEQVDGTRRARRSRRRLGLAVAAVALVASACGGSSGDEAGDDPSPSTTEAEAGGGGASDEVTTTTEAEPEALATLDVLDGAVTVQAEGEDGFAEAASGDDVAAGDQVQTDDAGFAALAYEGGAIVRIGGGATLTVAEGDAAAALDGGRLWLSAGGAAITVELGETTVATTDGVYAADCATEGSCRILVLHGAVEVQPADGDPVAVAPGNAVVVTGATAAVPEPATNADVEAEWVVVNAQAPVEAEDAVIQPGIFDVSQVVSASTGGPSPAVGTENPGTWLVPVACGAGPCQVFVAVADTPLTLNQFEVSDGGELSRVAEAEIECFNDATGASSGTAHEVRDSRYQRSEDGATISGARVVSTIGDPGPCQDLSHEFTVDVVATRRS